MSRLFPFAAVACIASVATGCIPRHSTVASAPPPIAPATPFEAKVLEVLDGDKLKIDAPTGPEYVRLWGIDAPEPGQPYYDEAAKHLYSLIRARRCTFEKVEEQRGVWFVRAAAESTPGYVTDLNAAMLAQGYAWRVPSQPAGKQLLDDWEPRARAKKLGIWAGESPVPPWEWHLRSGTN